MGARIPLAVRAAAELELRRRKRLRIQSDGLFDSITEAMTFRQWCQKLADEGMKVDGKPFRLDNRPALVPLYDAIPTTREEARDCVLVVQKATQLGLTVWEVLANIYMAIKWGPVTIGMFLPDQATASYKSEHRFMRIVRSVPTIYRAMTYAERGGENKRVGEGNVLTRTLGESIFLFLWTSGKVSTESRPMDIVTLDETQEMTLEQIDKVRARTGDSMISFSMLLSTANMPDLDINHWYLLGSQEIWHTECPSCGALSDLSDPAGVFPAKSIGYDNDAREYFWRCPECGGRIEDPQRGRLVATNPGAPPGWRSFLLPRTISPMMTPRKFMEAWGRAKTGDQKKNFYNRTLARPYIDADQLPVTMAHCEAAAAAGVAAGLVWKTRGVGCVMGIDQMGSFNAVIIKERMPDGRQAVVHVEAVFDLDPFKRCGDLMEIYRVSMCVVEQLPNVNDARRFANKFPGRVFLAGYGTLRDDQMQWGDTISRSDLKTAEDDRSRYTVILNQYKCMQTALFRIRGEMVDGKLVQYCLFPDPSLLEQDVIDNGVVRRMPILRDWVFMHFTKTALVVEQDEEERKTRAVVKKVGIDPHFAFANMLTDVAWARNHGTSMFILPAEKEKPVAQQKIEEAMPGLPSHVVAMVQETPAGEVCGQCYSARDDNMDFTGRCADRGCTVQARDPGCSMFMAVS